MNNEKMIGCKLPPVISKPFSDQYGALWQAARHCGLDAPPARIPGEWQHGWQPAYMNWHPEGIVGTDGLSRHRRTTDWQFVARQDQADALGRHGYSKVKAIGHPIIYTRKPTVERMQGSMLVMPVHSIATTEHQWNFDEYASQIEAIAYRFTKVIVCVSPHCIRKGYWVDAFRSRGFQIVSGAEFTDVNAYDRMANLFSRFEFMTSNGFGSHLAYSQYFGAKTSIYGTWPLYRKSDFAKDPIYQRCPELLDFHFKLPQSERVRENWPWLFADPEKGVANVAWARHELGSENLQSGAELRELFGWKTDKAPNLNLKVSPKQRIKKVLARTSRAIYRLAEPGISHQQRTMARLMALPQGSTSKVDWNGVSYVITNGPRAAREFEIYHQKRAGRLITNPENTPCVDLVVGDGIALVGLTEYHIHRDTYYLHRPSHSLLPYSRDEALQDLRISYSSDNLEIKNSTLGCCEVVKWLHDSIQTRWKNAEILKMASVIRISICPSCVDSFISTFSELPSLSLLVLECAEKGNPCITDIALKLFDHGFRISTSSIIFFSSHKNPDCHINITYASAFRLGETQRDHRLIEPGESVNDDFMPSSLEPMVE